MRRLRWVDIAKPTKRRRRPQPKQYPLRWVRLHIARPAIFTCAAFLCCGPTAWSQPVPQPIGANRANPVQSVQPMQNAAAPANYAPPKFGVASFAKDPIFSIAPNAKTTPTLDVQPLEIASSPLRVQNAAHATSEQRGVPTILDETVPVTVSLDFLVMSSLATRKAMVSFNGGVVIEPTTYFDFDISNQAKQIALAQFDPNIAAFLIGSDINRPDNSFFGPGLQQQNKIDEMEFNTRLSKNWTNGMITSVGYEPSLAYLFFPQGNPGAFNPTHSSDLVTRIEQPLLRGAGRSVNLVNLRVVEWKAQQSLCQIEAAIQSQLRSIEQVYWKLHAEYVRLRAIDTVITLSQKTLDVVKARYDAERVIYSDVARAEVKLEDLYQQRLAAELAIREASFALAQLSGLELDESMLLVPTNSPEFNAPQVNQEEIVASAISYNPNLRRQRQSIEIARQTICGAQNNVLPKLNLQAAHRTSGLEDDLGSSLKQMASFQFNDFSMGLQYTQQLGVRQARSQLTAARLQIAREQALLDALERSIGFDILQQLNKLNQIYERYESALRQVEQSKKWVEIARTRYEDPPVATAQQESILVTLVDYQAALQSQIDSIVLVANALADYNTALAVIDEKRGVLMVKWGIGTNSCDPTFIAPTNESSPIQTQISPNTIHIENSQETNTQVHPSAPYYSPIMGTADPSVSQATYAAQSLPRQSTQSPPLPQSPIAPNSIPTRQNPAAANQLAPTLHRPSNSRVTAPLRMQTQPKPFVPPLYKNQ